MQDIRIAGATGPCTSANNKSPLASEVELGVGGTSSWKLCTMTQSTSLGMFFEVAASHGTVLEPGQILCLQFQTQYQHPSGQHRLRVVTVARPWAEPNAAEVGSRHAHLEVVYLRPFVKQERCLLSGWLVDKFIVYDWIMLCGHAVLMTQLILLHSTRQERNKHMLLCKRRP